MNRYYCTSIFYSAWLKDMSMGNIIASFRAAGIYPLNRKAVLSQLPGTSKDVDAPQLHLHVLLPSWSIVCSMSSDLWTNQQWSEAWRAWVGKKNHKMSLAKFVSILSPLRSECMRG